MKVILKENIKSLGKAGDIVEASNGYARNFLIPKGKAVPVNSGSMNDRKLMQENQEKIAAENLANAEAIAEKLSHASVTIPMKFGENGKAFGSVTNKEISQAVADQLGLDVDKRKIRLDESLKEAGAHEVTVKLHPDVTASLTVILEEEA